MTHPVYLMPVNDKTYTAQLFFDLTDKNRSYLRQWLPWLDTVKEVQDTHRSLSNRVLSDKAGVTINCFMMIDNAIAGIIDVRDIKDSQSSLGVIGLVGYWISQEYSGKGYTTSALKQMILLCQNKGIDTLILRANPDNIASNKVALHCGFELQRIEYGITQLYGKSIDLNIYQLSLKNLS